MDLLKKRFALVAIAALAALLAVTTSAVAHTDVPASDPASVDVTIDVGESYTLTKTVTVPESTPKLDFCLLLDLSGSYGNDLPNIRALDGGLFDDIRASVPDSQFCMATFIDYPFARWGASGNYAYALPQDLTSDKATWTGAIDGTTATGGYDGPESQLTGLHQMATGSGVDIAGTSLGDVPAGLAPSWRADATKVIAITTDATAHTAGDSNCVSPSPCPFPYPGPSAGDTEAALIAAGITVIYLRAGSVSDGNLTNIAINTGGSVQTTTTSSSDLADAIVAGLTALTFDISAEAVGCDPLAISWDPAVHEDIAGGSPVSFTETISVPEGTPSGTYACVVNFLAGDAVIAHQHVSVTVPDPNTPPVITVPADVTIEATSPAGASYPWTATADDAEDGDLTGSVICDKADDQFPLGSTTVNCSVTDSGGLSDADSFTVTVVDTTPPDLTVPADETNEADGPAGTVHDFSEDISATDAVDPDPTVECEYPEGWLFPLGPTVVTCTATDESGNSTTESFTKTVVDTTPPVASCLETSNPSGNNTPKAGKNAGNSGQNPDGFYVVSASDIVGVVSIVLRDDASGVKFVLSDGDKIKLTQAPGVEPNAKPGSGDIDWKIQINGDATIVATDAVGNIGTAACLVPQPPK